MQAVKLVNQIGLEHLKTFLHTGATQPPPLGVRNERASCSSYGQTVLARNQEV